LVLPGSTAFVILAAAFVSSLMQVATQVISSSSLIIAITTAIPNSERVYAISADRVSSKRLDLNERSGVTASKNFEFGIAAITKKTTVATQFSALSDR
jgi:hypothetical protein